MARKIKDEAKDTINPSHYIQGGMELIDVMEAFLTPDEFKGFLKGNIIKYTCRANNKNGVEDLKKMFWYADKLIKTVEK